jgi:tellurium resistance protein TerD
MALKLDLKKEGEAPQKLKLNLSKGDTFKVELSWECTQDLDVHALLLNSQDKVTSFDQVLSCYNLKNLTNNANKSFSTPDGALLHSGDCTDGVAADIDEEITIDGSKIPNGIEQIPFFVTIHDEHKKGYTFSEVKAAKIAIKKSDGSLIEEFELTDAFRDFNGIQMGCLLLESGSWVFEATGTGFQGDFNTVLENFS